MVRLVVDRQGWAGDSPARRSSLSNTAVSNEIQECDLELPNLQENGFLFYNIPILNFGTLFFENVVCSPHSAWRLSAPNLQGRGSQWSIHYNV